ncbi:MAG: hypothetical protein ABFC63_01705 [Thermoguttaceae bacterium]
MSRKLRMVLLVGLCVAGLLIVAVVGLYWAAKHEPAFYCNAMATSETDLTDGSQQMLREAAALESVGQRNGRWQAVITAAHLNGWLAVDRAKNHPNLLPPTVHDPRVAIDAHGITIGCRFDHPMVTTVLSLNVQPFLSESNVVGLRIVRARAGAIPLPLGQVLDAVSETAHAADLSLRWRHTDGDPVALVSLPEDDDARHLVRIDKIELRDGEIRVSGTTRRQKP